jgi:lysozyme
MKITSNAINIIKQFEGCRLTAYQCPSKIWTIGYGTTVHLDGNKVKEGDKITQKQAEALLKKDIYIFEKQIDSLKLNVNQNQFDALVSLVYNVGFGNLTRGGLVAMIRANNNSINIYTEWEKYVYAKGVKLLGLVRRRKLELDLYFKSI